MSERPLVLVHGATGFTGGLVCDALSARGITYAASGRSASRLDALVNRLASRGVTPPAEVLVSDPARPSSVEAAVRGRRIVLACAGPFVEIGEPVLASCARLGVHYADTTGEQRFVADAVRRHRAIAESSGACIVPAMAFEIAPADWVSHLAAERVGGAPDTIHVYYANRPKGGSAATTRGTKRSILGVLAEREPLQFIDGQLRVERTAEHVVSFALPSGRRLTGVSFPSPEAVVVPEHTQARTVRTYMATGPDTARVLHRTRRFAGSLVRVGRPLVDRLVERAADGPDAGARTESSFTVIAEATKGGERSRVAVTGTDPYGLTAAIQAYAAEQALAGAIRARGVVAPSVAFAPREALAALASTGLSLVDPA